MFTVKTAFGTHRVTAPSVDKTYLHVQFPQDMRTVLNKLDSIETLLLQLVETTNQIDFQPPPAKLARLEGPSAVSAIIQATVGDIRDTLGGASEFILEDSIQVIKDDIDVSIFHEYRAYLPEELQLELKDLSKSGPLINSTEELEAFNTYLSENEEKADLFREYLQGKMYKVNDLEKVIRSLIADDCFLDFNYGGALGKMPLHQMMLFDSMLFNICYQGDSHEEYINDLKKIIHRAKNRIYKNRSLSKQKEMLEAEFKVSNPEEPALECEVESLNALFISALSNDTSASQVFPIADTLKLEALDRLLKSDANKTEQFKQFLRLLMVKHEDPDKVLLEIIAAEVFLKFNYSGTAGKKAIKDMVLFESLLFETCFKELRYEDYVLELKRIILRNKNRAYKIVKAEPSRRETLLSGEDELLANFEGWLEHELPQNDLANSVIFPISTPARLETLDEVLRANPILKQLLQHHVTKVFERFHSMDKVIPRFVLDEVFMEYNYAGVWGKNTLKDMTLFEKIFYEVCYKGQPFPIYVKELIRIVQVSKNRMHRKKALRKKTRKMEPSTSKSVSDDQLEEVLAEDAVEEFDEELKRLVGKNNLNDSKLFPIASSSNLLAFDRCLQADPERRLKFVHFLRKLGKNLDKVLEMILKDDLFLEYNYQGIKNKKSLGRLVLIDQVFYEAFGTPEGMSFQQYVKIIKRCCRRAANRMNKKRSILQKSANPSQIGHVNDDGDVIFAPADIETEEVIETDEDMSEDEEESV